MTILDACVKVLENNPKPLTPEQIYHSIQKQSLFTFKAKEPLSIVRGTLRKHLRTNTTHRVAAVDGGRYKIARS